MTTTQVRQPVDPDPPRTQPRPGLLLVVLLGGLFMSLLDISIVNVAIGSLRDGLHASGAQLQLIVSGYVMSYAVLLVTGARVGGRVGHAAVFRAGLAGFVLASAACGLAPSATALIVCRLVQGTAAAFMLPQVMSLIQLSFPAGPRRARALGWYGLVLAMGTVSGQLLGGALLQADVAGLGWRTIFLVNIPIGLVLLRLSGRALPRGTRLPGVSLDLPGTIVSAGIIGLIVIPLVLGHENGWPLWGFIAWGIAAVLIPLFVVVERGAAAPVIPGDLLRAPGLLMGLAVVFATITAYATYLFTFAVHLQTTLGMGPLATGLVFLPLAIGFAASSLSSPHLPARTTRVLIPTGLLMCAMTFVWAGIVVGSGDRPGPLLLTLLGIVGVGQGFAITPVMGVALSGVPVHRAGEASGLLSCGFQLAQVLGVAGIGSVFLSAADGSGTASATRLVCIVIAGCLLIGVLAARRLVVVTA